MPTKEVFWNQIGNFNNSFLYLHIVWIILSLVILTLHFILKKKVTNIILKFFLSLTFLFNSIFFFLINTDSPVSKFFYGGLFFAVGLSLFIDIIRNKIIFQFPKQKIFQMLTVIGIFLVYFYPVVGIFLGRTFPFLCMPMNPCPSTVLATVLVIAAVPKISKISLVLLLPWGLLALPKALGFYDCYEDAILFLAGLYGLIILIKYWKKIGTKMNEV
jgi:hypothetical protein